MQDGTDIIVIIEYEIGHWNYPVKLKKGDKLEWNSNIMKPISNEVIKLKFKSIEVSEILAIEIGYEISDVKLLVRLIED